MNHDILQKISMILNEHSYEKQKEESNEVIRSVRRDNNQAKDNVKLNDDISEEADEDEDENIFDKAKKEKDDEESSVKTPDESPSTIKLSDAMDFEELIKVLNQFRASRSLKDKEVYVELKKYFEKITKEEKQVLHVFIKGLTQITLLDVDGKAAYAPSDLKFDISKKGNATSEKIRSLKKKQDASKEASKKMSNSPIKIGESVQEKSNILSIVRSNND